MGFSREDWNRKAHARLIRALPPVFPGGVLVHALAKRFIPPTPRRAIESYWRAHPLRADRLARALAARSGAPVGWSWELESSAAGVRAGSFRSPPAPFRSKRFQLGPGRCCICGQPVYRLGWHCDLWHDGKPNKNATWHSACVAAWKFWQEPSDHAQSLKRLQKRRCASTGRRLLKAAEVDHRVPLFRVWRERDEHSWPAILAFWGAPNLQVVNREAHAEKCAGEAALRASLRSAGTAAVG